jgi:hypothetical protein
MTARSIRSVDVCRFRLGNLVGGAVDYNQIPPTDGRSVEQIRKGWPRILLINWASVGDHQPHLRRFNKAGPRCTLVLTNDASSMSVILRNLLLSSGGKAERL